MHWLALNSAENYIHHAHTDFVAGNWKGEDCLISDLTESDICILAYSSSDQCLVKFCTMVCVKVTLLIYILVRISFFPPNSDCRDMLWEY